jgi:heme o synthase
MINNSVNKLKYYLELSKLKIVIPVSLTGFTGYFLFSPVLSIKILLVCFGILLLAISASVLNQIQEVDLDSRMSRTKDRPIPAGRISVKHAFVFLLINLITGTAILYTAGNLAAMIIGLITIIWYNGIYTLSKRITSFAVVPGALTGALPPLIGWVAAGGDVWDKPVIFLEFLLFTGQIPHFWLLILKYGDEYKVAGIPSLTDVFTRPQINRLTFTWVVTSAFAALFLCYFEIIMNRLLITILLIASAILIWQFSDLIVKRGVLNKSNEYSIILYLYFLLILILLIIDRVIS